MNFGRISFVTRGGFGSAFTELVTPELKLDAYPFTRYGTLKARVERVSPDATVDQQRGLVFPVRLKITDQRLMVDGKQAALSPGMSSSAEIVTGTRRVIEYIWSPVARSLREAGRER